MLKGAAFTIGVIVAVVSAGLGILSVMADGMSDNPTVADNDSTPMACLVGFGVGVAMIVGAFFVP